MHIPAIWKRPHLSFPLTFDTIFFDVDGVLIKTINSFRATAIAVAEYVVGTIHGLDWGWARRELADDVAIKRTER